MLKGIALVFKSSEKSRDELRQEEDETNHLKSMGGVTGFQDPFSKSSLTIEDAIELAGYGKFQGLTMVAAGLCFMSDSMEVVILGFLSTVLRFEWNLTATQAATITGSVFAGEIVGALVLGRLGDIFGRRPMCLASSSIICLSGVLTTLADDFLSLVLLRSMVGFGVGGMTVPYDIYAEFVPKKRRARDLMLISYFWPGGSVFASVLAYATLGRGHSWRVFVFLCSIPCLVSAIMCFAFVPESPRWLLSKGRNKDALLVLRNVATTNEVPGAENIFSEQDVRLRDVETEGSSFFLLFTPKWFKTTLLLWGLWFGFSFSYYGTVLLVTRIFTNGDGVEWSDAEHSYPTFDYSVITLSSVAEFVGAFVSIVTVDTMGRISSSVMAYVLAGLAGVLMCLPYGTVSAQVLSCLAFLARASEYSGSSGSWISTAEILQTEIRTTGHSTSNAIGRIGAILASYAIDTDTPIAAVGILMALMHIFTIGCASQLPETKGVSLDCNACLDKKLRQSKMGKEKASYTEIL